MLRGHLLHELSIGDDVEVTLTSGRRITATFDAIVVDSVGRAFLQVLADHGGKSVPETLPLRHVAAVRLR